MYLMFLMFENRFDNLFKFREFRKALKFIFGIDHECKSDDKNKIDQPAKIK